MRTDAWDVLIGSPLTDYEQTLRRLAVSDDRLVASLAQNDAVIGGERRDERRVPCFGLPR